MNRILLLIALLHANINLLNATEDEKFQLMLQSIATGLHQIRLLDGKSLYGDTTAVMGSGCFDLETLDDDTTSAFNEFAALIYMLRHPVKNKHWMHAEYYTAADVLPHFLGIIIKASQLNPIAIQFLWHFLEDGNIHGVSLPGLKPQPERAAIFQELYEWRMGMRADANHALKAIRIERERLDAIAEEEEAKRKAEAEAKAAEQAARAAATEARYNAVRKPSTADEAATSTLRHRRATTTNDQREGEKQPLLRPIRAH